MGGIKIRGSEQSSCRRRFLPSPVSRNANIHHKRLEIQAQRQVNIARQNTRFWPSPCFSLSFFLHIYHTEMIIWSATCAFACPQFEWVTKLQFSWGTVHCYDENENDEVVGGRNALTVLWMMNWSDYRGSIITIVGLSGKPKLNDQRTSMPLHSKNARKSFSFKTNKFLQGEENWFWMKQMLWQLNSTLLFLLKTVSYIFF